MTAISYHHTVNDLQGLAFAGRGPFARLDWFGLLEKAAAKPLFALARNGNEAFALPLTATSDGLQGLTNWYAFTWSGLATGDLPPGMLAGLAKDLCERTSRVVLTKLPDEDGTASKLEAAFRDSGWLVIREVCDTNHVLPVSGRTFEEYLAARPGALRTTLKRKAKKVAVEIISEFQDQAWQSYEAVSHGWRAGWRTELNRVSGSRAGRPRAS